LSCLHGQPALAAETIIVREAKFDITENYLQLNARFDFDLPGAIEDALNKGIPLYFVTELALSRPRWYWFDEKAISVSRNVRITYYPLVQRYAVSIGGFQLRLDTLQEALNMVKTVHHWQIAELVSLQMGQTYKAVVRLFLDVSQMPKPFQVHAVNARDWHLDSGPFTFSLTVPRHATPSAKVEREGK
jgi:hypothetical protein